MNFIMKGICVLLHVHLPTGISVDYDFLPQSQILNTCEAPSEGVRGMPLGYMLLAICKIRMLLANAKHLTKHLTKYLTKYL